MDSKFQYPRTYYNYQPTQLPDKFHSIRHRPVQFYRMGNDVTRVSCHGDNDVTLVCCHGDNDVIDTCTYNTWLAFSFCLRSRKGELEGLKHRLNTAVIIFLDHASSGAAKEYNVNIKNITKQN